MRLFFLLQLFFTLFAKVGLLLRRQPLAGVAFHFGHATTGVEHAALLQLLDGLHPLAHALAGHGLHHRSHHIKLFEQRVNVLDLHAGPPGDTVSAAGLDDFGVAALL